MQNVSLKVLTHPPKQNSEIIDSIQQKYSRHLISFIIKIYFGNRKGIYVTNDCECVLLVVSNIWSIIYSWFIIGIVTRSTQWKPLEGQILPTLLQHLSSPTLLPLFIGVLVARSLVNCFAFHRSLFVGLSLFFWPLRFLSFALRILIIPLVPSIFS